MIEKQFYCDDPLEYRDYGIFDLSKADKNMDDFRDEDGICSWQFGNYLVDETDSMLTGEEVTELLNKQKKQIKELKQDLNKKMKFVAKQESESTVQVDFDEFVQLCKDSNNLTEANEQIHELEKQIKARAEELNYIQNSITNKIKHQKTKIGEKALRDIIEDYNEWMLGHK